MEMRPKVNIYLSRDELSVALAEHVAQLAAAACAGRGRFCIALSGGSLMDTVSPALCSAPLRGSIDWSNWHVFWADERWVPWSSPESNYGLARERFFRRVPIPSEQIHGMDNSLNPAATAGTYASILAKVFQPPEGQMPPIRITMTLPLINNGRNVVFVAAGPGKADIVSKVLNPQIQKQKQKLPAQLVNPVDGELQWFIDRSAAAESGYADIILQGEE